MASDFSLIKTISTKVQSNKKLIKASEYQALYHANDILTAANQEADSIVTSARQRVELAVEEGYQQGLASAENAAAETVLSAKIRANHILASAEKDLITLTKTTFESLLGDMDIDEKLTGLIQSGLASMRSDYRVTVRVAPGIEDKLHAQLVEFVTTLPVMEYVEVLADSHLSDDAYVLEGDSTIIRSSLSDQLAKLNTLIDTMLTE